MPITTGETQRLAAGEDRSVRPVIEHALTEYGYSPDVTRALIDRLISEPRPQGGQ